MSGAKKVEEEFLRDTFRLISKNDPALAKEAIRYTRAHDLAFKATLDSVARLAADLHQRVKALEEMPRVEYRGTWRPDTEYVRGNLVTHSGSLWWTNHPSKDLRPGDPSPFPDGPRPFTLVAKRGT